MATKLEVLPKRLNDYRAEILKNLSSNQNLYDLKYIKKKLYIRKKRKYELELKALDKVIENLNNRINIIF